MSDFNTSQWLEAFGYLGPDDADDEAAVKEAIAAAQQAYGLPVSGEMDEMTARVIGRTPRCAVPDTPQHKIGHPHWGLEKLDWCMSAYPTGTGLTKQQIDQAVAQAFSNWSSVCGLSFGQVGNANEANIVIGVGRGARANFDGPSGTLAWMYLPSQEDFKGQVSGLLDADEPWTLSGRGILLVNVLCHEIGHALGLMHSQRSDQLMSPTYSSRVSKPLDEDTARIQQLYGPSKQQPKPPQPGPTGGATQVKVLMADQSVYHFTNPVKLD